VPGARAAYLAYRAGAETARRLPTSLGRPLAQVASRGMVRAWVTKREQVSRHLVRASHGALHGEALDQATRQQFANYARYWYEMFRLQPRDRVALAETFKPEGREHLDAAVAAGKGVILALPHVGNWDLAGAWLSNQVPHVTVVAEPVEPPQLFDWFVETRRALGMEVVPLNRDAGAALIRALRAGHVICLLCDRDIAGDGVEVEFFGERTRLPAGPATLAFRTGAPLLPVSAYFKPEGHTATIEPPLPVERQGRLRDDVTRVTQDLAHRFEELISAAPEQWLLMQPNWPSDLAAERSRTR
jgi:phosphatidylinositol dimannoside acyltransferase